MKGVCWLLKHRIQMWKTLNRVNMEEEKKEKKSPIRFIVTIVPTQCISSPPPTHPLSWNWIKCLPHSAKQWDYKKTDCGKDLFDV